jgi:DNA (cytosine-5)-methyltransferase 1
MNYLDLFSGIGGFALGAYQAGWRFEKHYFSEVDDYAIRVYQQRFPEAINLGDITKIVAESKSTGWGKNGNGQFGRYKSDWIISGGFPCQDISCAGKGEGITGSRSGLWFAMRDVIRLLRPQYVIAENVGAITYRGLDVVLSTLAEIGYDAEWQDIRASDVGAPHRRERIWIVAYPTRSRPQAWRGDGIRDKQRQGKGSTPRSDSQKDVADTDNKKKSNVSINANSRRGVSKYERCGNNAWSAEPDVGRVAHGIPSRVDRLKCLGNSIVPQIAELIFRQIANGGKGL